MFIISNMINFIYSYLREIKTSVVMESIVSVMLQGFESFYLLLLSTLLRTAFVLNPSVSTTLPKVHMSKLSDTRC